MTRELNIEAGSLPSKTQSKSSLKNNDLGNKNGFANYLNSKTSSIETKNKFDYNLPKKSANAEQSKKPSEKPVTKERDIRQEDAPKAFDKGDLSKISAAIKVSTKQNSNEQNNSETNKSETNIANSTQEQINIPSKSVQDYLNEDSAFESIMIGSVQTEEIDLANLDSMIAVMDEDIINDSTAGVEDSDQVDLATAESKAGLDNLPNLWSIQVEQVESSRNAADSIGSEDTEEVFTEDKLHERAFELPNNNDSMSDDASGQDSVSEEEFLQDSSKNFDNEDSVTPEIGIAEAHIGFAQDMVESKIGIDDFKNDKLQSVNDNEQLQASISDNDLQKKLPLNLLSNKALVTKNKVASNALQSATKVTHDIQGKAAKPMYAIISSSANLFFADDGKSDVAARFFAGLEEARGAKPAVASEELGAEADLDVVAGKINEISDADAGSSSGDKSFNLKNSAQQINNFGGKIDDSFADKKLTVSFGANPNAEGDPKEFQQVSMSIRHAINSNSSEIKINMHPKALGAIDITLELARGEAGEQIVKNIKITAENKQTLEILEKSQIELQKTLSEVKESKDASLEFNMKKQDDQQGNLLYSNSEEREAWMNQFDRRQGRSNDGESGSDSLGNAEKSEEDSGSKENRLMPGEIDIKI